MHFYINELTTMYYKCSNINTVIHWVRLEHKAITQHGKRYKNKRLESYY